MTLGLGIGLSFIKKAEVPAPGYIFARQPDGTIIRQPDGKPVQIPL